MTRQEYIKAVATDHYKSTPIEENLISIQCFSEGASWADNNPAWIPVIDSLPDYGVAVLIAFENGDVCINHRSNNPNAKTDEHGWCFIGNTKKVTHWMSLPNPPTNETTE